MAGMTPMETYNPPMQTKCSVHGCEATADYDVIFYDVYSSSAFYQEHESCPYLCDAHMLENEREAVTGLNDPQLRKYRGRVKYPYTHSGGQGFVIYRPIRKE